MGGNRARGETERALTETRGSLEPGTIFEKYEVIRCIGLGGMGAVYEARHVRLSKRVALKTMLESLATKPETVQRIMREGETIARIRHPHVVDIYDVGIHEGVPYLVEEFLEGETLHDLLDRVGALSPMQLADVLVPIADALAEAHGASVVHRDLKPANIFLARDGRGQIRPKLLDFGISKMSDRVDGPSLTMAGSVIGTPEYMAPEQIHQLPDVDGRADQYALGVVMYECITGILPYQQTSLFDLLSAAVAGVFEPPSAIRPNLDPELELVVLRAMATDRAQRFPDMHEIVRSLLPFASERVRNQFDATGALLPAFETPPQGLSFSDPPSGKMAKVIQRAATLPATPARTSVSSSPPEPVADWDGGLRPRRSNRWLAFGGLVAAALFGGAYYALSAPEPEPEPAPEPSPEPAPAPTFEVALTTDPPEAVVRLDGRVVGTGVARAVLPRDGSEHVVEVRSPGYASQEILFRDSFTVDEVVLDPLFPEPTRPIAPEPPPAEEKPTSASKMRRQTEPRRASEGPLDIRLAR